MERYAYIYNFIYICIIKLCQFVVWNIQNY